MEGDMRLLFLAAAFAAAVFTRMAAANAVVPAIYIFGDSTVDVGNNNFLPGKQAKANFPPYGIDFPGRIPTGRFSNGYQAADYLAKEFGFKKSPPAYLSISKDTQAYEGVNFASGGSGIFDATGPNFSIPLNQQIRYFRGVSRRLKSRITSHSADRLLSKSILVFSTGNNDMIGSYFASGIKNGSQQDLFIGQLTYQFKNQLETLYNLGGRKFLVFASGAIGCIPILRSTLPTGGCVDNLNILSQKFNNATRIALHDLASKLKGFSYSFADASEFFSLLSSEPRKFGFTEPISACCGSGRFNGEADCSLNTTLCSNRNKYVFWDRFHTTQAFSKLLIRTVFRGHRYTSPVTIKQLVRLGS